MGATARLYTICHLPPTQRRDIFPSLLWRSPAMPSRGFFAALLLVFTSTLGYAQTTLPSGAATVWNSLLAPAMDPTKSAHVENVTIVRDAVRITLLDGRLQLAQPVNGVVFGAVFHGAGRVEATPPNALEGQQLRLFTKQDKLNMTFTEATFSFTDGFLGEVSKQVKWQPDFTDGFLGEVSKQVKWQPGGPAADDLYANRQKDRED